MHFSKHCLVAGTFIFALSAGANVTIATHATVNPHPTDLPFTFELEDWKGSDLREQLVNNKNLGNELLALKEAIEIEYNLGKVTLHRVTQLGIPSSHFNAYDFTVVMVYRENIPEDAMVLVPRRKIIRISGTQTVWVEPNGAVLENTSIQKVHVEYGRSFL